MMKKIVTFLCVLVFLTGCSTNQEKESSTKNSQAVATDTKKKVDKRFLITSDKETVVKVIGSDGERYIADFPLDKAGYISYIPEDAKLETSNSAKLKYEEINKVQDFLTAGELTPGVFFVNKHEVPSGDFKITNSGKEPATIILGKLGEETKIEMPAGKTKIGTITGTRVQVVANKPLKISTAYPKNSKERLYLPTAYGNNDLIHPSVVYVPDEIGGFKYWLAGTPYYKGDARMENPHIYASNDGVSWEEPTGLTNPIDEKPGAPADKDHYNSDTHLIFNPEKNRLECFYRESNKQSSPQASIKMRYSTDGVSWSEEANIFDHKIVLSPAIVLENGTYKMWFVDIDYSVKYTESVGGLTSWSEPKLVNTPYKEKGIYSWHLDVQKNENGTYGMLISSFKHKGDKRPNFKQSGVDRQTMHLYYAESSDGLDYPVFEDVLSPTTNTNSWDNRGLYRSCYINKDGQYIVYYSGIQTEGGRGLGVSYGDSMTQLKGLDLSNIPEF